MKAGQFKLEAFVSTIVTRSTAPSVPVISALDQPETSRGLAAAAQRRVSLPWTNLSFAADAQRMVNERAVFMVWVVRATPSVAPPERQPVVATKKLPGHDTEMLDGSKGSYGGL